MLKSFLNLIVLPDQEGILQSFQLMNFRLALGGIFNSHLLFFQFCNWIYNQESHSLTNRSPSNIFQCSFFPSLISPHCCSCSEVAFLSLGKTSIRTPTFFPDSRIIIKILCSVLTSLIFIHRNRKKLSTF